VITGIVTADRDAIISLTLYDAGGNAFVVDAVVDTGFNGYLTLPLRVISALQLRLLRYTRITLADGSKRVTGVYEVTHQWDGLNVTVSVTDADGYPLVGMSLMYGFKLDMAILDGATFTLVRIADV
jgi:clan AA aspartic protease